MEHKLYIAPECKHLVGELKKYKHPAIAAPRIAQKYDHMLDPYLNELAKKMLRRGYPR